MKFSLVVALLVPVIAALPAAEDIAEDVSANVEGEFEALACADNLCVGVNKNKLCNDRCKRCSGPSGTYKSGACGGLLWQTCICYYD